MVHKSLLFTLLVIFPLIACAQRECKVSGEYSYYTPQDVSLESARATAIEQARIQALANEFGTLIEQTTLTRQQNENGKSYSPQCRRGAAWELYTPVPPFSRICNSGGENISICNAEKQRYEPPKICLGLLQLECFGHNSAS